MKVVRVGTRGSRLALKQTSDVVEQLQMVHPGLAVEIVTIKTYGDDQQSAPVSTLGTKAVFVKEIEEALLAGAIDFALHSLKDMPSELPDGLEIVATPVRADARDALISHGLKLRDLPLGARIGTSSARRRSQIRAYRGDLMFEDLRGNIDTRLRRLDAGEFDAIVLACAGLDRIGCSERITERLSVETCVPAPGQGALALEIRSSDRTMRDLLQPLNDPETAICVAAERAFQTELNAGCSVPAGAYCRLQDGGLQARGVIAALDGEIFRAEVWGASDDPVELGSRLARDLLDRGGERLARAHAI